MHELYIAECIFQTVKRSLPPDVNPSDVRFVHIRVGRLDAVVADSLIFLFEAIRAAHSMPDAKLEIEQEDVSCICECGNQFRVEQPVFLCPACGSGRVRITSGRGIAVQRITVNEKEGTDDGDSGGDGCSRGVEPHRGGEPVAL